MTDATTTNTAGDDAGTTWVRSRRADMVNVAIVAFLLVACAGLNYAVDPFGLNRAVDLGLDKEPVSHKLSYFDWKLAGYLNDPRPVILLGDSRVGAWSEASFEKTLGKPTFNLAFAGGSTTEAIDAFWFASEQGKLERVYLGLNLSTLNGAINLCRTCDTRAMFDSPLRYYLSPLVSKATWLNLYHATTGEGATSERPPMDRQAFWQHQLGEWGRITGETFRQPDELLIKLREMARWCQDNKVALTFVLPPTHRDLAERQRTTT